jgi:hypothetical protein
MVCRRCKDVIPESVKGKRMLRTLTATERYWLQFLTCEHCGSLLTADSVTGSSLLDRLAQLADFGLHAPGQSLFRPREPAS